MTIFDVLKGKKVKVMTDVKVEVELIIESAEEIHHSEDVGPSTRENDWWPPHREWTTIKVKFTNGVVKHYSTLKDLKLAD
mgnify:CR=1 FL=1